MSRPPGDEDLIASNIAELEKGGALRRIVVRALRLINPKPEQRESCATIIRERVALLHFVSGELRAIPSSGDLKKELQTIVADLKRTKTAICRRSAVCKGMVFHKDATRETAFLNELDRLIESAKFHHNTLVVRRGSPRWDNAKAIAAKDANELLRSFSDKSLTKAAGGPFYRLASLLYEGATRKKNVNLEQYCRALLDGRDRIEPSIVLSTHSDDTRR